MEVSIEQLHAFAKSNDVNKVLDFLDYVGEHGSKKQIELLFDFFSDDYSDDIMFSVIHIVETLPDLDYVKSYLNLLDNIYANAPTWAGILLIRIVNNATAFSILKANLANNDSKSDLISRVRLTALEVAPDLPEFN